MILNEHLEWIMTAARTSCSACVRDQRRQHPAAENSRGNTCNEDGEVATSVVIFVHLITPTLDVFSGKAVTL